MQNSGRAANAHHQLVSITSRTCSLLCLLLTCSGLPSSASPDSAVIATAAVSRSSIAAAAAVSFTHSPPASTSLSHHSNQLTRILYSMPPRKKQRIASDASVSAVAGSASAAAAAHPPPPHTRLYSDVLGATFGFLTFSELRSAMMVCRSWLAAVYAMHGLTAGKSIWPCRDLAALLASRLSRHVIHFDSVFQLFNPRLLQQAVVAMPFLRTFAFGLATDPAWQRALPSLRLPSTLQKVLLFGLSNLSVESINALITMLSRHAALTKLELIFHKTVDRAVSFAPLQAATSLTKLTIQTPAGEQMKPQHLQQIRQLAVTKLDLYPCTSATLLSLLQMEGPPLRWSKFSPHHVFINDAVATLLPTLSHLVELSSLAFSHQSLSSFHFLSQLPALRSLEMNFRSASQPIVVAYDACLVALHSPLQHLTSLRLESSQLTTAQLTALLSLTPRLESLRLDSMYRFDALTFLLPVKDTLRSLHVTGCCQYELIPAELQPLLQLQQLTELSLIHSLSCPLDNPSLALFTPPTQLLPTLKRFSYRRF